MSDIQKVVDDFLKRIGKPDMTNETKNAAVVKLTSTFEEWNQALRDLPHVIVLNYDLDNRTKNIIFWVYFPGNRSETHPEFVGEKTGFAIFKGDGTAEMNTTDDDIEGTWQEIFQKLKEFVTTELELPPLPNET